MKRFPATLILLALAGTAAVYFGVPRLREWVETFPWEAWIARAFPDPTGDGASAPPEAPSDPFRRQSPPTTPRDFVPGADSTPGSFSEDEDAGAPRYPAWGVVRERTRAFNGKGKFSRSLPGGVLVEKTGRHESSIGPMAECRIWFERRWVEGVFIPDAALVTFEGPAEQAPESQRETLRRYFTLRDAIERRRRELDGELDADHPRRVAYREARDEYEALRRRSRELREQRDQAEGAVRIERIHELADLRRNVVLAEKRLRRATEALRETRDRNRDAVPETDGELKRLRAELAQVEPLARKWLDGE